MTVFRPARRADVPAIVALLAEDAVGATRDAGRMAEFLAAWDAMEAEAGNTVIVGTREGRIVATYQLTVITGLSLRAARRAQVESVRVASDLRSHGIGAALMADAEDRARAAGCDLVQLTTDRSRTRAHAFYDRLGYTPSHLGYKKRLD